MLKIIYAVIIIYFLLLALLFVFQRNMMYYPSALTEFQKSNSGSFNQILIEASDGLIIKSWIAYGEADKKTFVFFHGNAGNAADRFPMLKPLEDAGHTVVLAEYRGFGDNPGYPNETDIISDAEKLLDFLTGTGISENDIILMGRSLGTGIATNLATKYNVSALALISPYSSFPDVGANAYPIFPVRLLMRDQFDSKSIIDRVSSPIIMFHGDSDSIIPIRFGEDLFDAANEPKTFRTLTNYGHNNLDMNKINSDILNFIQ